MIDHDALRAEVLDTVRSSATPEPDPGVCVPPYRGSHTNLEARGEVLNVEGWTVFRDRAADDVPCVVQGLWPEGAMGFIAGPPKKGKTWLAHENPGWAWGLRASGQPLPASAVT